MFPTIYLCTNTSAPTTRGQTMTHSAHHHRCVKKAEAAAATNKDTNKNSVSFFKFERGPKTAFDVSHLEPYPRSIFYNFSFRGLSFSLSRLSAIA